MKITADLIKYLETLGRIELSESEEEKVGVELEELLAYIDMLGELDTNDVEAMSHCFSVYNVFREDVVEQHMTPDDITANAPESQDGAFVVPKTVE